MQIKIIKKMLAFIFPLFLLTACNGFFEKDNTPPPKSLVQFIPSVKPQLLWSKRTGQGFGKEYAKMTPVIDGDNIYTASPKGTVTSINKVTGKQNWQVNTPLPIVTGPGAGDGIVVVIGHKGRVLALDEAYGRSLWEVAIAGEILASPAIDHGVVVVKSIDGSVRGLDIANGTERWVYQQTEPNMILRGASKPLIYGNNVFVGFSNGSLAKLSLNNGGVAWVQTIAVPTGAFAIQRMIDIDADPIIFNHHLYAATYQGKIASLQRQNGRTLWSHNISSYTGMSADDNAVYVTDASSYVWSFDANTGLVNWRQTDLKDRVISAPVVMDDYLVMGDIQGYLHWLDKTDGHFVGRVSTGAAPIFASPLVDNGILYAFNNNGYLSAYILR